MEKMPDEIYAWMGFQDNGSWDREPCVCDSHESVKYIRADLADLSPQPVPAGWQMVPIEPTSEMLQVGSRHYSVPVSQQGFWQMANRTYKAMLAAAPETHNQAEVGGADRAIELLDRIDIQCRAVGHPVGGIDELKTIYRAMLAAAPEPPTEKLPHIEGLEGALFAAENYQQADMDGIFVTVSRQALDAVIEAAREYLKRMEK